MRSSGHRAEFDERLEPMTLSSTSLGWPRERSKAWTWEILVTQRLREATPRVVRGLSFASALTVG